MEDGKKIIVQSKSEDKMENEINRFYVKSMLQNCEFFIKKKLNYYSTIEENKINRKENLIFVEKKSNDNSAKSNNNLEKNYNCEILGHIMNIGFFASTGLKIFVKIGKNNTFKDAANKYCNLIGVSDSLIGKEIVFIYNGGLLDVRDKKNLGEIFNNGINIIIIIATQNNAIL